MIEKISQFQTEGQNWIVIGNSSPLKIFELLFINYLVRSVIEGMREAVLNEESKRCLICCKVGDGGYLGRLACIVLIAEQDEGQQEQDGEQEQNGTGGQKPMKWKATARPRRVSETSEPAEEKKPLPEGISFFIFSNTNR